MSISPPGSRSDFIVSYLILYFIVFAVLLSPFNPANRVPE